MTTEKMIRTAGGQLLTEEKQEMFRVLARQSQLRRDVRTWEKKRRLAEQALLRFEQEHPWLQTIQWQRLYPPDQSSRQVGDQAEHT